MKLNYDEILNQQINLIHSDIVATCTNYGVEAPSMADLSYPKGWTYLKGLISQLNGKVRYVVDINHTRHGLPCLNVSIHTYKQSGASTNFNGYQALKDTGYFDSFFEKQKSKKKDDFVLKKPKNRNFIKQKSNQSNDVFNDLKARQEKQAKEQVFNDLKNAYNESKIIASIDNHKYLKDKHIESIECSRVITYKGHKVMALPIVDKHLQIQAFQLIFENGNKIIHGSKKGGFVLLKGELKNANRIFIGEGVASVLSYRNICLINKKKITDKTCFISSIDANNLDPVIGVLRNDLAYFKDITICADNDNHKFVKYGNKGLEVAYSNSAKYDCSIVIPNFDFCGENTYTDWSDLYLIGNQSEYIQCRNIKKPKNYEAHYESAYYCNREQKNKLNSYLINYVNCAMHISNVVNCYNIIDTLFDDITAEFDISNKAKSKLMNTIKSAKGRSYGIAMRNTSLDVTRKNVHIFNTMAEILKVVPEYLKLGMTVVVKAQKGTGKTQGLANPILSDVMARGGKVIAINPDRSLTKASSEMLNLAHYQKDKHDLKDKNGLAVTINSYEKDEYMKFNSGNVTVYIDEPSQVLTSNCDGVIERHRREHMDTNLANFISRNPTLMTDADFSNSGYDWLNNATDGNFVCLVLKEDVERHSDVDYKIHAHGNLTDTSNFFKRDVLDAVAKGEILYVVADSKKALEQLEKESKDRGFNPLLVTADTLGYKEQSQFVTNPNLFLKNTDKPYNLVLCSPAIKSGLSIEIDYFTKVFGLTITENVDTTKFMQMLHRVRGNKLFDIYGANIRRNQISKSLTSADYLLNKYIQQDIESYGGLIYRDDDGKTCINDFKFTIDKDNMSQNIEFANKHQFRYAMFKAEYMATKNLMSTYPLQIMVLQAKSTGAKVDIIDEKIEKEERAIVKEQMNQIKEKVELQKIEDIIGKNTLSDNDYDFIQSTGGAKSKEESAKLTRHEIAQLLGLSDVTKEDYEFIKNGGAKHMRIYKAIYQGVKQIRDKEIKDREMGLNFIDGEWKEVETNLVGFIFDYLMNDLNNCFSNSCLQKLVDMLKTNTQFKNYLEIKMKENFDNRTDNIKLINKILDSKLGLKAKYNSHKRLEDNKRIRMYSIDTSYIALLEKYIEINNTTVKNRDIKVA